MYLEVNWEYFLFVFIYIFGRANSQCNIKLTKYSVQFSKLNYYNGN